MRKLTNNHAFTQEKRILMLLEAAYPDWTPAPVLARVSLQYSARIYSLRREGWQIANRIEHKDGEKHGFFRLAQPLTYPNPRKVSTPALNSNPTLFDIGKEHDDRG